MLTRKRVLDDGAIMSDKGGKKHRIDVEVVEIVESDEEDDFVGVGETATRRSQLQPHSGGQENVHAFLKDGAAKLCKLLKLSDDVVHLVRKLLEYIVENRDVSKGDKNHLQAIQMSLCWIATDILGQKIEREALLEAAKILKFKCHENLANSVYEKLIPLKENFQQLHGKTSDPVSLRNVVSPLADTAVHSTNLQEPCVNAEFAVFGSIHRCSGTKVEKILEENNKFCQALEGLECSKELERRALEKKCADKMEDENRKCEDWLTEAEAKYGRGGSTTIDDANPHELESGNDDQLSKNCGSTLGAPPSIIAADALMLDVSGDGEIEVVDNEPAHMQMAIPLSDVPATTNVSLPNPNDLADSKLDHNVPVVTEIPTTNKDTETDSVILGSHVDPLPENEINPVDQPAASTTDNGTSEEQSIFHEQPDTRVNIVDSADFKSRPDSQTVEDPNNDIAVDNKKHKKLRKLKKKIEKHKLGLLQKHEEEIHEFNKKWNSKREVLENEHQVELTVISHIYSQSAMKMDKHNETDNKFDIAMNDLESAKETKLKELENKQAAEVVDENRNCENWLAEAEKKYGGGHYSITNEVDTHGFETSNDRQFSPTGGTTTRVLGRSPPTTITSDPVVSDVSANGETELMTMQGGVPVTAEQFEAAKISSQNPNDVTAAEATSNGHIVDEIQSTNIGTGADSGLLENHGGSPPQDEILITGMDLTDDPLMLLDNNGDTEVQPDLCQNPVASSHECDDPAVSVYNPGLEAASLSDCQGDREQTDLHANIMDSADGGNHFESHASEDPGNMPHEQLGLGNASDVTNTASSHNHTLSEVAGNEAEFQNGDVLPLVQQNEAASQNPASISRAPTIAVETQHRPVLSPGPSSVELPNVQAAWNQRLRMLADPLQGEIDKMLKSREQMIKMHEYTKLHLRADCEKVITEVTTQIHNKYAEKVKDAESSYLAKRTEIEANQSKVFMNKLLAEAFRSKYRDFSPSGAPVAYPGMPSVSLQQHTQLVPLSSSLRNSPVSQPASTHHQTVNPAHRFSSVGSSSSSLSTSQTGIVQQQTLYPPICSIHSSSHQFVRNYF